MESTTRLCVRGSPFAVGIDLPGQLLVITNTLAEVVGIDEIIPGVVRRVDINQLDLAGIALLQQLEHFQVVAFDHQVLGAVPVDTFLRAWPQRAGAGGQGQLPCPALAVPVQAVLLVGIGHRGITDQRLEHIDVDGGTLRTFGDQLGKQRLELLDVARQQVGRPRFCATGVDLVHRVLGHPVHRPSCWCAVASAA